MFKGKAIEILDGVAKELDSNGHHFSAQDFRALAKDFEKNPTFVFIDEHSFAEILAELVIKISHSWYAEGQQNGPDPKEE